MSGLPPTRDASNLPVRSSLIAYWVDGKRKPLGLDGKK